MNFDFKDLVRMERLLHLSTGTARTFADGETRAQLMNIEYVFAEVRHAAYTLSDPTTTNDDREAAKARLVDLFKPASN